MELNRTRRVPARKGPYRAATSEDGRFMGYQAFFARFGLATRPSSAI